MRNACDTAPLRFGYFFSCSTVFSMRFQALVKGLHTSAQVAALVQHMLEQLSTLIVYVDIRAPEGSGSF